MWDSQKFKLNSMRTCKKQNSMLKYIEYLYTYIRMGANTSERSVKYRITIRRIKKCLILIMKKQLNPMLT